MGWQAVAVTMPPRVSFLVGFPDRPSKEPLKDA